MVARRSIVILFAVGMMARAQEPVHSDDVERALRHTSPEWQVMAPHMPDPATATPQALTAAADVLRARRMPEDALDFYRYALKRGGDEAKLQNCIGVTLLELQRYDEARAAFKRAVKVKPKDAQAWNNLGATEYVSSRYRAALEDYERAVRLDKKVAVFHSNLGTAYFELKDFESARSQYEKAVRLDPAVFHSGGWAGVQAHVMAASDRGRFYFEMAKMAAETHNDDDVIRWLARSSETGYDVKSEMIGDKNLEPYRKNPRVVMALANAHAMLTGQIADSGLADPAPPPQ